MAKKQNLNVEIDLSRSTGNFWMDNGLVVLANRIGKGQFSLEKVKATLVDDLYRPTGNLGEYFEPQTQMVLTYKKRNWIFPANLFIKASPRSGKITIKGKRYFTSPPEPSLKLSFGKKGTCDVCGDNQSLTDAKMWMFPFIVDPEKFGNFYPGTKRGMRICPRCALAGLAGYLALLWQAHGKDALHIFLFHTELRELALLHQKVLRPLQLKSQARGGSVSLPFWGPYLHETTLALLLELFSHVESSELLPEEGRSFLAELLGVGFAPRPAPLRLYAITGKQGQAFDVTGFEEFSRFHELYRLYREWKSIFRDSDPHASLVNVFIQFQVRQKQGHETLWRDRIAQAVLDFQDPFPSVEDFLFVARPWENNQKPLVFGTLEVLRLYAKEVLKMDEQLLKTLKDFGHNLGDAVQKKNETGLLYALRNAKNVDEFLRVLNDVQFRLELTVPDDLLAVEPGERIKGSPWKRVKTLLSIYAKNKQLMLARSQSQQKKEG